MQVLFRPVNQVNHQNFDPSLIFFKCWLIFIGMKQKKIEMANSKKLRFSTTLILNTGNPALVQSPLVRISLDSTNFSATGIKWNLLLFRKFILVEFINFPKNLMKRGPPVFFLKNFRDWSYGFVG